MCFGVSVQCLKVTCLNLNERDNSPPLTLQKDNFDLRADDTTNRFSIIFQQVDAAGSNVSITETHGGF